MSCPKEREKCPCTVVALVAEEERKECKQPRGTGVGGGGAVGEWPVVKGIKDKVRMEHNEE